MCYCDVAEFIERGIFIRCCAVNCVLFSLGEIIVLVLASYYITRLSEVSLRPFNMAAVFVVIDSGIVLCRLNTVGNFIVR